MLSTINFLLKLIVSANFQTYNCIFMSLISPHKTPYKLIKLYISHQALMWDFDSCTQYAITRYKTGFEAG